MSVQSEAVGQSRFRRPNVVVIAWIILGLLIILILFPLLVDHPHEPFQSEKQRSVDTTSLLPTRFTLNNYARVLGLMSTSEAVAAGGSGQTINFLLFLRNSLIVTTTLVIGQIFFSALAAYAFARLHFPLRDQIWSMSPP